MRPGQRYGLSEIEKRDVWSRWKAGQSLHEIVLSEAELSEQRERLKAAWLIVRLTILLLRDTAWIPA
jgi:hypothetical protein